MTLNSKLNSSWWALRIGIGLMALLAGLDKFFDILANWSVYVSPLFHHLLPVGDKTFLHLVGLIEDGTSGRRANIDVAAHTYKL